MSALEPCPFCGGTEGRFTTDSGNPTAYTGKWGWWECSCGARAEDVRTGYDADGWQSAAIAAWNRRATPAEVEALRARVERLEEALRQYVVLGHGRCTIGKPAVEQARAALGIDHDAAAAVEEV